MSNNTQNITSFGSKCASQLNKITLTIFVLILYFSAGLYAAELNIGTATADITPKLPVALFGQFHLRIAETAETPLTANVVALESRDGNHSLDAAIMVSCDLLFIPDKMRDKVRDEVHKKLPELDTRKIFLNATHTHTSPVLVDDEKFSFEYQIPEEGVSQPEEYCNLFAQRVSEAIVEAWGNRRPGSVTWGLSHAAVGYNRRAVYADGSSVMYGNTNDPGFLNIEGMEDHDINTLFFWDMRGKLIAMTINVACTAQEVEGRYAVNADFWHPVREKLKKRFGPDLCVLGWISAAGDQSPRPMYRKAAEERMIKLRNLNHLEEIARRLVIAVEEAYETVNEDRYVDVKLTHKVENLSLPMRLVTKGEYKFSKAEQEKYASQIANDPEAANKLLARMTWNRNVVYRFEKQKKDPHPKMDMEMHVIRLGDVVICTNEFELFTDYGMRIQARSNALQTFVVQLAGPGSYLPTEKAVNGGGYSGVIQSGVIGPKGGQVLVDNTVKRINEMFNAKK